MFTYSLASSSSLINLMVSVDVKHRVYFTYLSLCACEVTTDRQTDRQTGARTRALSLTHTHSLTHFIHTLTQRQPHTDTDTGSYTSLVL